MEWNFFFYSNLFSPLFFFAPFSLFLKKKENLVLSSVFSTKRRKVKVILFLLFNCSKIIMVKKKFICTEGFAAVSNSLTEFAVLSESVQLFLAKKKLNLTFGRTEFRQFPSHQQRTQTVPFTVEAVMVEKKIGKKTKIFQIFYFCSLIYSFIFCIYFFLFFAFLTLLHKAIFNMVSFFSAFLGC